MMDQAYADRPEPGGPSGRAADTATGAGSSGSDLLSCLPIPAPCADVIRRLRAPGMTLRYSLDKQIIPDLDAAGTMPGTTPDGAPGQGGDAQSGETYNTMSESGSLTVRFFDLAVGGALIAVAVCVLRCCRGMRCACRRWL